MEPLFTFENAYVALTDQSPNKWLSVYHHNGKLYSIGLRSKTFNQARDLLRDVFSNSVGLPVEKFVWSSRNYVMGQPKKYLLDLFRVTNGVRVKPKYTGMAVCIDPTDGYTQEEILSQPDGDFLLTAETDCVVKVEQEARSLADNLVANGIDARSINLTADTSEDDPLADQALAFPAYWRPLPKNWRFIDTYRIDDLFPLNDSRLTHARKKLLVCGTRTGGKSVRKDVAEAYATLGQWLKENPDG